MANKTGDIDDSASGWSFHWVLEEPGVGYIVQALKHDGISYIFDLALERILVSRHPKAGTKNVVSLELSPKDTGKPKVKRVSGPDVTHPGAKARDPLGFYTPRLAVKTVYEVTELFDEPNQRMTIEYELLFTAYGKNPSHEPSGVLNAARVYPVIRFQVDPVKKDAPLGDPRNRVCAVQAVVPIQLGLVDEMAFSQAGIFHDLDRAGGFVWSGLTYVFSGVANTVFDRAEKPVLYEVVGRGVTRSAGADWDNVHAWKAVTDLRRLPPTPGLPLGMHTHWRWAESFADGTLLVDGGPQFGGIHGGGTAIVDPKLPDQSIEFALTFDQPFQFSVRRDIDKDPDGAFNDFSSLFTKHRKLPDECWKNFKHSKFSGDVLILWNALTAYSSDFDKASPTVKKGGGDSVIMNAFEGRLFVHGLFCAHDSGSALGTLPQNAYDPQYEPMPSKKNFHKHFLNWRRPWKHSH
jgi:hypothetical protein